MPTRLSEGQYGYYVVFEEYICEKCENDWYVITPNGRMKCPYTFCAGYGFPNGEVLLVRKAGRKAGKKEKVIDINE